MRNLCFVFSEDVSVVYYFFLYKWSFDSLILLVWVLALERLERCIAGLPFCAYYSQILIVSMFLLTLFLLYMYYSWYIIFSHMSNRLFPLLYFSKYVCVLMISPWCIWCWLGAVQIMRTTLYIYGVARPRNGAIKHDLEAPVEIDGVKLNRLLRDKMGCVTHLFITYI